MYKADKKRISLWIPTILNERLDYDSKCSGITKSDIIRVALLNYYRGVDSENSQVRERPAVSSGKPAPKV